MSDIHSVLSRLEGVKRSGTGWIAKCPCHEDRTPSLSITERDGKVLWHCQAGCPQETVGEAIGAILSPSQWKSDQEVVEATYDYTDEMGGLLYQVLRYPRVNGKKKFRQRQPDGSGGWIWNMQGVRKVLYRLPGVIEAVSKGEIVVITEGEKDADAVFRKTGKAATSSVGGSGSWKDEYAKHFQGAKVYIVADKDDPGRHHAATIRDSLLGVASEIYVMEAREGKDAYDHLSHGLTLNNMEPVDLSEVSDEVPLSSVEMKSVEWHMEPFVQVSAFHLLAGPGKVGKGTWLALLMAKMTTGDTDYLDEPRNVLIVSSEDSVSLDLKPRLIAAGGDPSRVHLIKKAVQLPRDIEYLEGKIDKMRGGFGTSLVIIDPVANHIGGVSGDEEGAVRNAINELNYVADRTGCAIIGVRHVNKTGEGTKAVLGSVAWTNSPRVVLMMEADPTSPDTKVLTVAESNRGGKGRSIRYDLKRVEVEGISGLTPVFEKHSFAPEVAVEPEVDWYSMLA